MKPINQIQKLLSVLLLWMAVLCCFADDPVPKLPRPVKCYTSGPEGVIWNDRKNVNRKENNHINNELSNGDERWRVKLLECQPDVSHCLSIYVKVKDKKTSQEEEFHIVRCNISEADRKEGITEDAGICDMVDSTAMECTKRYPAVQAGVWKKNGLCDARDRPEDLEIPLYGKHHGCNVPQELVEEMGEEPERKQKGRRRHGRKRHRGKSGHRRKSKNLEDLSLFNSLFNFAASAQDNSEQSLRQMLEQELQQTRRRKRHAANQNDLVDGQLKFPRSLHQQKSALIKSVSRTEVLRTRRETKSPFGENLTFLPIVGIAVVALLILLIIVGICLVWKEGRRLKPQDKKKTNNQYKPIATDLDAEMGLKKDLDGDKDMLLEGNSEEAKIMPKMSKGEKSGEEAKEEMGLKRSLDGDKDLLLEGNSEEAKITPKMSKGEKSGEETEEEIHWKAEELN